MREREMNSIRKRARKKERGKKKKEYFIGIIKSFTNRMNTKCNPYGLELCPNFYQN